MTLLQINLADGNPSLHGSAQALRPALRSALAATSGPVTFLVHGYKYAPGHARACPHRSLLSRHPSCGAKTRVISWPTHLDAGGLTIAIGWPARGALWSAYARAEAAGSGLAALAAQVAKCAPDRSQNVLAHSLGARVALQALEHGSAFDTVVLMAAAEYRANTQAALDLAKGRSNVLHVTSGENDLYDFLFERLVAPQTPKDSALGTAHLHGLQTLVLDAPAHLAALADLGFEIAGPQHRICHWSPYLRPGVFGLYRALIQKDLPFERLSHALGQPVRPRWSRGFASATGHAPLPLAQDASV